MTLGASRAVRAYALCAAAAVLAALIVVLASASVRHLQAGAACAPWPQCYGQAAPGLATAADPLLDAARGTHRAAASAVLLIVLAMNALAWRSRALRRERSYSLAALLVVLGLAAFGALTTGSHVPAVIITNLAGGLALLALLTCALPQEGRAAFGETPRVLLGLALAVVVAQAAIGSMIGANRLLTTCATPGSCSIPWREALASPVWDVLAPTPYLDRLQADNAGPALLHWMHRRLAMAVLLIAILVAGTSRRETRALAWTATAAAFVAPILGLLAIHLPGPLLLVVLHDGAAALLVAALARGMTQSIPGVHLLRVERVDVLPSGSP